MTKLQRISLLLLAPCVLLSAAQLPAQPRAGSSATALAASIQPALEYRMVGPYRGGRSTAVAGVPGQPQTYYMGTTGGGVWRTTDGGEVWENISDGYFEAGSIGAVAVAPSNPALLYAGTGSACIRGNVSAGIGIYRSADGGKSWSHAGLRDAGQIGRVRVHPTDPRLVYVAALGHVFGPNEERGVFRSRDGGDTWEKVLYLSERTGAADLVMDPTDPSVLYAAMWTGERLPWTLTSGGEESGIFRSRDGGDSWERLTVGLPAAPLGRIGVAVSPTRPNRVWAIVEAEEGGLYRSDDGGDSFTRVNGERMLFERAWYYGHVYAHPQDENTVYVLTTRLYRSTDGGRSFDVIPVPHVDNHDLWLNPDDPETMIGANDGGAAITYNGGRSWSTQYNQPTAEFYRVTVDNRFPYRIYGAQQDNSTLSLPSRFVAGATPYEHWYEVGGGESGHIAVHPENPDIVYAGSYGGTITRLDRATGHIRNVTSYPYLNIGQAPRDLDFRFQWNAPIRISSHDPRILYHTSNHVHRSTDEGQSWQIVSPDLTRDDETKQDYAGGPIARDNTSVETFGTIFAFEESPHHAGELWAGSDDGRVNLSRDGGASWRDITPPEMPEWATVNALELSVHQPGRAFLAVHRYRLDDFRPYIFQTDDYGASWRQLADGRNGIPETHFVRVVREDPDRTGLLYAGTEFGMYVSFDDGTTWQPLQLNLPITPITDLTVHRQDLVVTTQGRGFWILDDLTPLHQLSGPGAGARLYEPRDAYRMELGRSGGPRAGENPPSGALLHYSLGREPKGEVKLEILDAGGAVVRVFSDRAESRSERLPTNVGLNRFVWDLRYPAPYVPDGVILRGGVPRGAKAVPGRYQVRLTVDGQADTRALTVLPDPRLDVIAEDLQAQFDLLRAIHDRITTTYRATDSLRDLRARLGAAQRGSASDRELLEALAAIEEELIQTRLRSEKDPINFPPRLDNQLAYLANVVGGGDGRPTEGAYQIFELLNSRLQRQLDRLHVITRAPQLTPGSAAGDRRPKPVRPRLR